MRYTWFLLLMMCLLLRSGIAKAQPLKTDVDRSTQSNRDRWADSVYRRLSTEERIGQLFMVAAYSGGKDYNETAILRLIDNHQVGGLIFMQGSPAKQALLNNKYQERAQLPLLVGMDAEWGLGMRLDSVQNLPRQMMLGATRDTALVYQAAMIIAYQCRRLGVHINFGPDVDINNNPNNPVINSRSFGENKYWVTRLAAAYMNGLQDNGVMACLKHFPGHGNTATDSHKELPVIKSSLAELRETELYPFQRLIAGGAQSVMVAHLEVPALEQQARTPTTLSKNTITNLLKAELGFRGLVFTDALNMQGVAKYYQPGELELKAFQAGNDILLFPQDVPAAITRIRTALEQGQITARELEQRVKKVLAAKYGLTATNRPVRPANLLADLNQYTPALRKQVAEAAATLVRDENRLMSRLQTDGQKVQYIGVNASSSVLSSALRKSMKQCSISWLGEGTSDADAAFRSLDRYDVNIIAIHNTSFYPGRNYGLSAAQLQFLKRIQQHPRTIVVLMGNAYILQHFCQARSVLVMYEDDSVTQQAAAAVLNGNIIPRGKLPVTVCPAMKAGAVSGQNTLNPALPFSLDQADKPRADTVVAPEALARMDLLIKRCISERAFPGCRVYASQNGKIICNRSYGFLDYQKETAVTDNTVYDVASVTKVLSTTLAVMKLYEEKKLDLDKKLKDYLPWTLATDKANITIRNLLLHQAGLKTWIPFYKETIDPLSSQLRNDLYRYAPATGFTTRVAKSLFVRNDFSDTIWKRIMDQPLEVIGKYSYSDLDYFFLQRVVEQLCGQALDEYVQAIFYTPMGLKQITYQPLKVFPLNTIAPTENDQLFRHQVVRGYVHDQAAALLGGVAGHAGLFATAGDVAAIFEMLLQDGVYKGKRYLAAATVKRFTAYNTYSSRRGLGFDKPAAERNSAGPAGDRCSGYAFGHQGFTGTCAWADPATGIVFVFLSNRVYPSADNNLINKLSVRTAVQDDIYEAVGIPVNRTRPEVYQAQLKALK